MPSVLAPNLIFPALEEAARARREPANGVSVHVRGAVQHSAKVARTARQQFSELLRLHAIRPPRPARNEFTVLDLQDGLCRWPVTDEPPHLFCGAAADGSYCTTHRAIGTWDEKRDRKPFKHFTG